MILDIKNVKCLKCGHKWTPRVADVRMCPACASLHWDRDKSGELKRTENKIKNSELHETSKK